MLIDHFTASGRKCFNKRNKGFTMIEALIALVVFSIGLLGLASMYSKSMMVTHSAYLRSLASIQAMDMAERMRANIALNHSASGYELSVSDSMVATEPQQGCSELSRCTADQLRDWDTQNWLADTQALFGALFESASIAFNDADDEYEIVLQWRERDPEASAGGTGQDLIDFTYRVSR